jgi:hypothetical protein
MYTELSFYSPISDIGVVSMLTGAMPPSHQKEIEIRGDLSI